MKILGRIWLLVKLKEIGEVKFKEGLDLFIEPENIVNKIYENISKTDIRTEEERKAELKAKEEEYLKNIALLEEELLKEEKENEESNYNYEIFELIEVNNKNINEIIKKLKNILNKWAEEEFKADYEFLIGGSLMLEVNTKNSDIDAIYVVKENTDNEINDEEMGGENNDGTKQLNSRNAQFFGHLNSKCLDDKKENCSDLSFYCHLCLQEKVNNLKRIRETRVPLLKFEFYGIDIDISYVQIPEEIKNNKNWMDEALNNAMNNNNSIYGNQFGFLSGTSMLIMLTKIYLLYPNTCSVLVILDRFFLTFLTWNWPRPFLIGTIDDSLIHSWRIDTELFAREITFLNKQGIEEDWVDVDKRDKIYIKIETEKLKENEKGNIERLEKHSKLIMPILTPAYPQQSSAFNVNYSTMKIIKQTVTQG
uniref:polynucleotide adenylyltransferase n=1 Tax=Meloidogyne javanica TaxID=6303 RepID=A0A915MPM9_MELJA